MTKLLMTSIVVLMAVGGDSSGWASATTAERSKATHRRARKETVHPYKSQEIQALLHHVASPPDKIQVYSLWIDSLKLRITQADQDRLAGKINDRQYDDYLNQIAKEIYKISKAAKKLGFDELADMWEGLAFQYTKSMDNLLK